MNNIDKIIPLCIEGDHKAQRFLYEAYNLIQNLIFWIPLTWKTLMISLTIVSKMSVSEEQ